MKPIKPYGKITGYIKRRKEGLTYISYRQRSKHYFRKYQGYGISTDILRKLKENNIKHIIIIEKVGITQNKLETQTDKFYEKGKTYMNKYDTQKILPKIEFKQEQIEEEKR